jgi:hypothetical protein
VSESCNDRLQEAPKQPQTRKKLQHATAIVNLTVATDEALRPVLHVSRDMDGGGPGLINLNISETGFVSYLAPATVGDVLF